MHELSKRPCCCGGPNANTKSLLATETNGRANDNTGLIQKVKTVAGAKCRCTVGQKTKNKNRITGCVNA